MVVFEDFEQAQAELTDGDMVCGTYKGEQPVYFHAHVDASPDQIRDLAFEVRNGRKMSSYEQFLLGAATDLSGVSA